MIGVQTSICFTSKDKWLLEKVRKKAEVERKSQSAVILAILEEYFVKSRKIGEILENMRYLSSTDLIRALEIQKQKKPRKLLGEILVEENFVNRRELERALTLQDHLNNLN